MQFKGYFSDAALIETADDGPLTYEFVIQIEATGVTAKKKSGGTTIRFYCPTAPPTPAQRQSKEKS